MTTEEIRNNLEAILKEVQMWNELELNEFGQDTLKNFEESFGVTLRKMKTQSRMTSGKLMTPQCRK